MSSQLIWELVKKNNCFLSKNLNGTVWSSEPSNLTGKNSYKFSGLANLSKNVGIVEQDGAVSIQVPCKKHSYKTHRFAVKKNARRSAHAAGSVAKKIRPDLEKIAKAKAGAISRGIRSRNAVAQN